MAFPVRRQITIPAPIASYGEPVLVLNYRTRDERWEPGEVTHLTYGGYSEPQWRWMYNVTLDRSSATGRLIRLQVGDDKIKARR